MQLVYRVALASQPKKSKPFGCVPIFAQMNLASDSSKSPQRLHILVAEATCYC